MGERVEGKWIYFGKLDMPERKTEVWQVISKHGGFLGGVKWFGRWRTYSFYPEPETIYEDDCLMEIANFIKDLMEKQKNKRLYQNERRNKKRFYS